MEETQSLYGWEHSESNISQPRINNSSDIFNLNESLSTTSFNKPKFCVFCKQKINDRDYPNHVENCNGQKSLSSRLISSTNKQNFVFEQIDNELPPHHQSYIEVDSVDENTDYPTVRASIPPLKVNFLDIYLLINIHLIRIENRIQRVCFVFSRN